MGPAAGIVRRRPQLGVSNSVVLSRDLLEDTANAAPRRARGRVGRQTPRLVPAQTSLHGYGLGDRKVESRVRQDNRLDKRGKVMGFTAVVHFSGAGIAEITREPNGRLQKARSLFPQSRGSHCGPHTTRVCFLGRYLLPGMVQRLEHRIAPDAQGAALMAIDLIDAGLVAKGTTRSVVVQSDLTPALAEHPSLKQLWDASAALDKIKPSELFEDYAVIVDIPGGDLGSEDPILGNWEDATGPIASPNDRLTATIQCKDKLTIKMDPVPIDLAAPPGETIHVSFTNLPSQIFDPEHIHFGILQHAMVTPPKGSVWPRRTKIAVTNPPPWCPYVRYEISMALLAAPGGSPG